MAKEVLGAALAEVEPPETPQKLKTKEVAAKGIPNTAKGKSKAQPAPAPPKLAKPFKRMGTW